MDGPMQLDTEFLAVGEARSKARSARAAFDALEGVTQEQADALVRAMAVDETGYGVYEDKILKNLYNAKFVAHAMLQMRTLGVQWVDEPNRVTAIGAPMSVRAGIIPVANPTSTTIFKCLAAIKSGNAIVCAPHPRAVKRCLRTVEIMAATAPSAPAPQRACSTTLRHVRADGAPRPGASHGYRRRGHGAGRVFLGQATLAVGAGNVPVYIHRSVADVSEAALMVVTSKAFDNGTACVAEQAVVLDEPIADAALQAFERQGTVLLDAEQQARLAGRCSSAVRADRTLTQLAD